MGRRKKGGGHFCWCCGAIKSNEAFSGKGHARHLCKVCSKLGAEELAYRQHVRDIERLLDWDGVVRKKQRKTFEGYLKHPDPRVRAFAEEVAAREAAERAEHARLRDLDERMLEERGLVFWSDEADSADEEIGPVERPGGSNEDDIPF